MSIDEGFAFGPAWSAYCWDTRVSWDKLPGGVLAALIDPLDVDGNSRLVVDRQGTIVVQGAVNDSASLRDEGDRYNQRLQPFETVDAAIAAVIGEPWYAGELETGLGRALVVPKYLGHLAPSDRFVGADGGVYDVRSEQPHPDGLIVRALPRDYMPQGPEEVLSGEPADRVWLIITWL
jgi:hypothetical protein